MTIKVVDKPVIWTHSDIIESGIEKSLVYLTPLGALYEGDCLQVLPYVRDEVIDTIFADPPFNLSKEYGTKVNDNRT
ncbi:MAG: site-specific DNA-methyltransferase, partial [Desulfobacteraceae bacterium]|nr:site-specific DNA-methyltransferase [Desulfobacteraceae bacterium]